MNKLGLCFYSFTPDDDNEVSIYGLAIYMINRVFPVLLYRRISVETMNILEPAILCISDVGVFDIPRVTDVWN